MKKKKNKTLNSCWLHLYSFFCNILWAGTFSWQQIYSYRIHLDKSLISSAYLIQIICWIIFELLAESIRCFCLISQITILDWRRSPFVTVCYISLVLRVPKNDTLQGKKLIHLTRSPSAFHVPKHRIYDPLQKTYLQHHWVSCYPCTNI